MIRTPDAPRCHSIAPGRLLRWVLSAQMLLIAVAMSMAALFASAANAQESYLIGPGDVLSISFLSNPQFNRKLTVGVDGTVFIPLIGELSVSGQTIKQLRGGIPVLLTGAVFRERINGEELLVTVAPDEVMIDVSAYRPIYVDGAVIAPGRQSFAVGMTVRQAIAGADGIQSQLIATSRSGIRLQDNPQVLVAKLIGVLAEMSVHKAFLEKKDDIDRTEIDALNAPPELVEPAVALARSQVTTSSKLFDEQFAFLERSVTEAKVRVLAALRHEEVMAKIVQNEEAEVTRVQSRVTRGLARSDLLFQTRRLYLQAVERLSNVQASRFSTEDTWRGLVLKRDQAQQERSMKDQARLQILAQQAAQLRVQIKLSSVDMSGPEGSSSYAGAPSISIFRRVGGEAQQTPASPDTPLMPGDVVNVRFGG